MNGLELLTLEMEKRDLMRRLDEVEQKIKVEEERRAEEERRRKLDPLTGKEMYIKVKVIEKAAAGMHQIALPASDIPGRGVFFLTVRDSDLLERLPHSYQFNPFFHTW